MKERQLMIANSDCESGALLMSGNRAADDDPSSQQYHIKKGRREVRIQPDFAKRLKMDYEQFKESFIEDLKAGLADKGFEDVSIKVNEVNKLNESYEAISVTPVGENIGINTNLETFFESYENGADYDAVVAKAVDVA